MDKSRLESRRKDFKKNFEDPRRRREDAAVQIRKANRELQVSQKRSQPGMPGPLPAITMNLVDTVCMANSDNPEDQLQATQQFRKLLAVDKKPPIQQVIDTGIVPRLISFLRDSSRPMLQLEAAWTLTNIASGNRSQTQEVTSHGAIPIFVELLSSNREDVRDQAVWALGNIAGDCPQCRDMVLDAGGLEPLLLQLQTNKKNTMLRNATWALSNLCRGSPGPELSKIQPALPMLRQLIQSSDFDVLTDACWALTYLLDTKSNSQIDLIIQSGVCNRLVELLMHPNALVQNPALRSVGQIIAGTNIQTEIMIQANVLAPLASLLKNTRTPIKKEACWVISNIAAGTHSQIQALINNGIMQPLIQMLSVADFDVVREVTWAVSNAIIGGTPQQIEYMVEQGVIKPLCNLLAAPDKNVVQIALEALDSILKVGETKKSHPEAENPYVTMVEEAEGFTKLEQLQFLDPKSDLFKTAVRILKAYFPVEEDDFVDPKVMSSDPAAMQGGFGNVGVPQGGFHF